MRLAAIRGIRPQTFGRRVVYRRFFWAGRKDPTSESEQSSSRFRTAGKWTFGLALSYGTFAVLSHHYSSETRFDRIRKRIHLFAHDKLERAKWQSVGDVEKSLTDEENEYNPTVVEVITEDTQPIATGWTSGNLNFFQSALSFSTLSSSITSWEWPASLMRLRNQLNVLMLELGRGKGSLWSEVVEDALNSDIHPETQWDANVRLGDDLCFSEKAFLRERKRRMVVAFSRLFDVPVEELDERDIPIVAIAASGGGFRAMCNTAGALRAAQSSGILDVTTYIAAISGSCWTLGALYSGVAGAYTPSAAAEHLRQRVQLPYLDSNIFDMIITSPTNKYLLTGLIQKAASPNGFMSLVDIYGTLISSRLFCPADLSHLNPRHLSLSYFRLPVDQAMLPMPIFTAVSRTASQLEQVIRIEQAVVVDEDRAETLVTERQAVAQIDSDWLWYEFSPYEVGCDELGAWIPTWSFGREFNKGKSVNRAPEVSFTILAGVFASAFCASLQHYYREVKPILSQLPGSLFGWISEIVNEREAEFDRMHPVPPNQLPNFVRGLEGQLREGSPEGISDQNTIGLMDAGVELNIPYYPLLRRDVDCIIALDASADSQDLWFTRAEAYAARKGLKNWPRGAQWPKEIMSGGHIVSAEDGNVVSTTTDTAATATLAAKAESDVATQANKQKENDEQSMPESESSSSGEKVPSQLPAATPLPTTYVWIGSSKNDDGSAAAPIDDFDEEVLASKDGIGIVYMPILANEEVVPGMDPYDISTFEFELSLEKSSKLMDLAEYNFLAGEPKLRVILKAMWLRKMRARKEKESQTILRFEHPI